MQVTYEEIEPAIGATFTYYGLEVNAWRKENWRKVFATLQSMEPDHDCDMSLRVVPGDVSGYYDEEAQQKNPEYTSHMYSLTSAPWREWLGMEVDEDTLNNMSVADILGNCIYEMTWWGYDEETIRKNIEERFNRHEEEKEENDTEVEVEVDVKTQCMNCVKSLIPAILPSIVQKLGEPKFEKTLQDVKCEENGAYYEPIDLKALDLPLTGLAFFYIYINGSCMMGVTTEIEGEFCEIIYNWYASSMDELKTMIDTEDAQNEIVEILVKQVENRLGIYILSGDEKTFIGIRDKLITSITIPDGVEKIEKDAFSGCDKLQIISLPDSINREGVMCDVSSGSGKVYVFQYCNSLQQINVGEDNKELSSIDGVLFNKDKSILLNVPQKIAITDYVVPRGVKEIGGLAFVGCRSVVSVTIPESVENISSFPFVMCRALQQIIVEEKNPNYTSVDGILFNKEKTTLLKVPEGKKLTHYVVPKGVVKIGSKSFHNLSSLVSVQLPDSVNHIVGGAFDGCDSLETVYVCNLHSKEMVEGSNIRHGTHTPNPPSIEVVVTPDP